MAGIASRAAFEVTWRAPEPSARIVQISAADPAPTTKATVPSGAAEGSEPEPVPPGRSVRFLTADPSGSIDQTSSPAVK